jgi:hypothetical protein
MKVIDLPIYFLNHTRMLVYLTLKFVEKYWENLFLILS